MYSTLNVVGIKVSYNLWLWPNACIKGTNHVKVLRVAN